jgi:nucleotide sugar dehydrogenase
VIGVDVNPKVVSNVNAGRSHVREEAGLDERVAETVAAGRLRATTDTTAAVKASQVVVVIVPLHVDEQARVDFDNLDAATSAVAKGLQPQTLVIYETTLPVGTTRGRLLPALEKDSGLKGGRNLFLAFSPERVYSGRIFQDLARYPKIVGGVDEASTERAVAFYRSVLDAEVRPVANAETAEFTKLAETSYRDVNIALANELALYARRRGVDATQAFAAANSQPFSNLHRPSMGVGGHCIPIYPQFVIADSDPDEVQMLRLGRKTNDGMVQVAVDQLNKALDGLKGKTVLVLGLSYRENVKELAFSVALRLIPALQNAGARVVAHDPLFEPSELDSLGVELVPDLGRPPRVDAIVIQAFHREYEHLDWSMFPDLRAIFDGRGKLRPEELNGINARYLSIAAMDRGASGAMTRQKVSETR